jgi:hypothetical protein
MKVCRLVAERVVAGEELAELAPHVAGCERCMRLVALPRQLATALEQDHDPGLGFSARMTVAARQRLAQRHRRRIAGGLAATVAAAAVAAFVMTRPSKQEEVADQQPTMQPDREDHRKPVAVEDSDLLQLVDMANTPRARKASAPWGRIQRPLKPYKQLVEGVTP